MVYVFFQGIDEEVMPEAEQAWQMVWQSVAGAIAGSKHEAERKLDILQEALEAWTLPGKFAEPVQEGPCRFTTEQFWIDLYGLAETRLLIAKMTGKPGRVPVTANTPSASSIAVTPKTRSVVCFGRAWPGE